MAIIFIIITMIMIVWIFIIYPNCNVFLRVTHLRKASTKEKKKKSKIEKKNCKNDLKTVKMPQYENKNLPFDKIKSLFNSIASLDEQN